MHSFIDIMSESQKRHTVIEPKKAGIIYINGKNDDFTELFNIKGSGCIKSLFINSTGYQNIDIKIEIDGKTIYNSSGKSVGYINGQKNGSNITLIFGDKNNLRMCYNGSNFIKYYISPSSSEPSAACSFTSISNFYMFDTSADNLAAIQKSSIDTNTAFISDGGIEFKKSFVVSARRKNDASKASIYAGIEYMML